MFVLPGKLGGGVWAASQNRYATYDQNLRFSLPYLIPDQRFDSLFMTVVAGLHSYPKHNFSRAFVEVASSEKYTQFNAREQNHTPYL